MKSHGLLVIMFLFSSGCALFGGSTTEEPAGCPAHPDQPNDARNYRAADAERDFTKRRALAAEAAEKKQRAAQTPQPQEKPESKPATPVIPKKAPTRRKGKTAPQGAAEIKKSAPDPDFTLEALKLEAAKCELVVEAKRETQKVRTQLEEARCERREQAQPRPDPGAQKPMRPECTANGAVWSWRTILEGVGVFFAWLLLWLRGEARLQRWGQQQAKKAKRLEQEILVLKAEIANLRVQLQQQTPKN